MGLAAHGFGDISVLGKVLKVLRPDAQEDVHRGWNRRLRIASQVMNYRIIAGPTPVHRD